MAFAPVVVPARPETLYPDVRIVAFSTTQGIANGPVVVQVQCQRCRTLADGTTEDAPPGTSGGSFGFSTQCGIATVYSDPRKAQLTALIYEESLVEAVRQGHLKVAT